jgi:hypothetical protein
VSELTILRELRFRELNGIYDTEGVEGVSNGFVCSVCNDYDLNHPRIFKSFRQGIL